MTYKNLHRVICGIAWYNDAQDARDALHLNWRSVATDGDSGFRLVNVT